MTSTIPARPPLSAQTGHVALNVTDIARSIDFYRSIFGFELLGQSTEPGREYAFLGRGDQLVLTLWQQSRADFSPSLPGLHHLAFNVDSLSDVEAALAYLREHDVPLIYDTVLAHMPGLSSGGIFFTDPDGIRIELCTASGLDAHPTRDDGAPSCGFF